MAMGISLKTHGSKRHPLNIKYQKAVYQKLPCLDQISQRLGHLDSTENPDDCPKNTHLGTAWL